jgi:hypothetical protein
MRSKESINLFLIFFSTRAVAQWQLDAGAGVSFPITGYGKVCKDGLYYIQCGMANTDLNPA